MSTMGRRMPSPSLIAGAALIVLAVATGVAGVADWSHVITVTSAGMVLLLWPRRVFRPDVTRTSSDEVVIRFAPWFEGFVYATILASPVLGATITMRELSSSSSSAKKLIAGLFLLAISPFIPWACARLRRKCLLRITPAMLNVATMSLPEALISRDEVDVIVSWNAPQSLVDRRWVAIAYHPAPEGSALVTRLVGSSQLTVEPDNLLHALQAWKNAEPGEPSTQLMDRVEAILRGRPQTGPTHQHWDGGSGSGGKGFIGAMMFFGDVCVGRVSGRQHEKTAPGTDRS